MGAAIGRIGTTGANPFTMFLARIVCPVFYEASGQPRHATTVSSVQSNPVAPKKIKRYHLFLCLNAREISRSSSRFLIVSRLSNCCLPLAKASSTLISEPLK